jgi:small subunit ribosomal protein S2
MTDTSTAPASSAIERLFSTGAHFAHVKARRHPSMKPFVVGAKGRHEIIDLAQTATQIEAAKGAMSALAREGKTILLVGGKTEISALVKAAAQEMNVPYVAARWLGGTISNWSEIKKRIDRFAELSDGSANTAKNHTKLELLRFDRERERLETRLDGVVSLTKRPDALLVVDTKHERHAVKEARDAGIPIIAIMSSDCDVKDAKFPIVANDSSRDTVRSILAELVTAFKQGRAS